ncbi:MAG: potassium channel family protein [Cytophagales bacterium]|nr:potassium channel family protein [Cytophagales bacterium]
MKSSKLYKWGLAHRHPIFLVGLISFFILPELFERVFLLKFPFQIMLTILVVASVLLIQTSPKRRFLTYGLVLALLIFLFIWNLYQNSKSLEGAAYMFLFIYFSFTTFYLFKDLMRSQKITASVIMGAFAGYFMIGVIYFFVYGYLDSAYPDTISVDMTKEHGVDDMLYFSFITLTTIGYGDFSPTSPLGQKIAILQGLIGQFYIAIVMAILVGKFLSHNND